MLAGRAIGGPRNGVKLSCPSDWDGRILKADRTSRKSESIHEPGKYFWSNERNTWVWEPAASPLTHRRTGNMGLCGAGKPWPTSIMLTTNALRVTCPDCRERMQRANSPA